VAEVERQPHKASGKFDAYEPSEIVALWAHAPEPYGSLFAVAGFTGLRMGELRALRWANVDFSRRLVHVHGSYVNGAEGLPKSGKVRSVPLVDHAMQALEGLREREFFVGSDDLVFISPTGSRMDDSKARKEMAKAAKAAGLKPLNFHCLRHSFGTMAVQVFPVTDVMAMMGHADLTTTMQYVHSKSREDDASRLSDYIAGQTRPKLAVAS
jgi:integrase